MLMKHFINSMKNLGKTEVFLICHIELISMYDKYVFIHLGESDSDHGRMSWHEINEFKIPASCMLYDVSHFIRKLV